MTKHEKNLNILVGNTYTDFKDMCDEIESYIETSNMVHTEDSGNHENTVWVSIEGEDAQFHVAYTEDERTYTITDVWNW